LAAAKAKVKDLDVLYDTGPRSRTLAALDPLSAEKDSPRQALARLLADSVL
jgi:hypothetical protein